MTNKLTQRTPKKSAAPKRPSRKRMPRAPDDADVSNQLQQDSHDDFDSAPTTSASNHDAPSLETSEGNGDDEVGYKKPPKKNQFRKGQSGNPSGKRVFTLPTLGNDLEDLGDETVETIVKLLSGRVRDLNLAPDDLVTTAFAKTFITEAFKKDGAFRKTIQATLVDRPLKSEKFKAKDYGEIEADLLRLMAHAIYDPGVSEEDVTAILREANEFHRIHGRLGARPPIKRTRRRPTPRK